MLPARIALVMLGAIAVLAVLAQDSNTRFGFPISYIVSFYDGILESALGWIPESLQHSKVAPDWQPWWKQYVVLQAMPLALFTFALARGEGHRAGLSIAFGMAGFAVGFAGGLISLAVGGGVADTRPASFVVGGVVVSALAAVSALLLPQPLKSLFWYAGSRLLAIFGLGIAAAVVGGWQP
ncbi:MAG: hypothetical protein ACKVRO_19270 [Micropepsaceae bacterium]